MSAKSVLDETAAPERQAGAGKHQNGLTEEEALLLPEGARPVPDALSVDPEVTVYADETAPEEDPLLRRLVEDPAHSPALAAGDLDAAWDAGDVGDESVGGTMPTPDQDNVDALGEAAGVAYQDDEPLALGEKVEDRDLRRWELDPASSEDYEERARELAAGKSKKKEKRHGA